MTATLSRKGARPTPESAGVPSRVLDEVLLAPYLSLAHGGRELRQAAAALREAVRSVAARG